ncbi:hypothetical protein HMI54_009124 [Coelomomyces lativittatus]|nr:hypothetical protein HMI54_009124 [Coelomomyces lativittatus]
MLSSRTTLKSATSCHSYTGRLVSRSLFTTIFCHSTDSKANLVSDAWVDQFQVTHIPKNAYQLTFVKSRGPGGQNVNKCNSKVILRLPLTPPPSWLPSYCVKNLKNDSKHLIAKSSEELIIASDQSRSQYQNIEICLKKLLNLIKEAGRLPKEPSLEQKIKVQQM